MSALVVLPDEGKSVHFGGPGAIYKLLGEQTKRTLPLVDHTVSPSTLEAHPMQIAARRAFLTQDHRLALVWRLLSYLFLFIVVNLVANVARVVLESVGVPSVIGRLVFTLLYISGTLGLTYGYRRSIDRRSWQGIALPPLHKRLLDVMVGMVSGILIVALVFGLESASGWIHIVGFEGGTNTLTT